MINGIQENDREERMVRIEGKINGINLKKAKNSWVCSIDYKAYLLWEGGYPMVNIQKSFRTLYFKRLKELRRKLIIAEEISKKFRWWCARVEEMAATSKRKVLLGLYHQGWLIIMG